MTPVVVRPAVPADHEAVLRMLRDLDLDYRERDLARFVVAETAGEVVGIAEVREFAAFCLLSCVGVREDLQGRGLGRALVQGAIAGRGKDVHLFTLIPEFFERLGFTRTETSPPGLVARLLYRCEECRPDRCSAMVRRHAAR